MYAANNNLTNRSWLSTPINKEIKIRKQKETNENIWLIFKDFLSIETDEFWKDYWSKALKGIFPNDFAFDGKVLSYSLKNNIYRVEISDNIEDSLRLVKYMFKEYGFIQSPKDLELISQREELSSNCNEKSWDKYSKCLRDNLILDYVNVLTKKYKLNRKQKKLLHQTISIGVAIEAFNNSNIYTKGYAIIDINGLAYDEVDKRFYIDTEISPYKLKKTAKSNKNTSSDDKTKDTFYSDWKKITDKGKETKNRIINVMINEENSELYTTCAEEDTYIEDTDISNITTDDSDDK